MREPLTISPTQLSRDPRVRPTWAPFHHADVMGGATWVTGTERSVTISEDAGQTTSSARSGHSLCYPSLYHWRVQSMSHFSISSDCASKGLRHSTCRWPVSSLNRDFLASFFLRFRFSSASSLAWEANKLFCSSECLRYQNFVVVHRRLLMKISTTIRAGPQQHGEIVPVQSHTTSVVTPILQHPATPEKTSPRVPGIQPVWSHQPRICSQQLQIPLGMEDAPCSSSAPCSKPLPRSKPRERHQPRLGDTMKPSIRDVDQIGVHDLIRDVPH